MTVYDKFRLTAARLFEKLAVPATITSAGAKTRDDLTGDVVSAPSKTRAVRVALSKRETVTDNSTEKATQTAVSNGPAKAGDTLTIGGKTYAVIDFDALAPDGGTPILWTLVLS